MSIDWFRLDGKVALVTGAAQGIGQAIAHALAAAGAKLIISDRQAEKLAQTAAALERDGREVVHIAPDTKLAASEARNSTTAAISSGFPGRPSGTLLTMSACSCSVRSL